MSENGEIYTAGKNFTLPPALTAWTNSTSGEWVSQWVSDKGKQWSDSGPIKSFKPYHLLHGKGPTVHSTHINCALCTECSWCLVKCSWKRRRRRRRRRRSGGVEENTACGKSLPASQRSPTLTSELHSTHRLSAAHCTQRSLLRLIF